MKGKCDLCKKETDNAFYRGITYPFPYYDKNKVQVLCKECYDKGMEENKEWEERHKLKIKVGDTVIRKDGLKGKVTSICYCSECKKRGFHEPAIVWENGQEDYISSYQASVNFEDYYLIGHTILGNKATEENLQERIAECDREIEEWKKQKKQLRKQLWRLREEMVEDWKERKQARMNKKENQTTDKDTED